MFRMNQTELSHKLYPDTNVDFLYAIMKLLYKLNNCGTISTTVVRSLTCRSHALPESSGSNHPHSVAPHIEPQRIERE